MYKLIVWVSGRDWNHADSSGVASSLLSDGATLTAGLNANPWGIELLFFIKTLFKEWGGILGWAHAVKTFSNCLFFLCIVYWSTTTGELKLGESMLVEKIAGRMDWYDCAWTITFELFWVSWDWVGHLGLFDVPRGRDSESVWEKVVLSLSLSPMPYTEVPGVQILWKRWFQFLPDIIIRR